MEALTEEKAKVHIDGLPVEATEDEGCARAALAYVEEQMILGTKVEACNRSVIRERSPIRHALPGESSNIQNGRNGKKIFVGGLPSDLKIEEFSSFFERFGKITDAVIIPDAVTRRSRGFGFVTFDSSESVDEVLQSSRYIIKDKNVEVKLAIPKQEINAAAQQSIGNRPIVNGHDYYYTWEIGPYIYGYHHHFNAYTLLLGMPRFLAAAPQLYGNNRTGSIRITNMEDDTSSYVVGDNQPSPTQ